MLILERLREGLSLRQKVFRLKSEGWEENEFQAEVTACPGSRQEGA